MNGNQKREKFWGDHVRAWRARGLTQVQYGARHGVSRASLQYWSGRVLKSAGALSLVPVARRQERPGQSCVLRGANGWELEFPDGTPASYLAEVLGAL